MAYSPMVFATVSRRFLCRALPLLAMAPALAHAQVNLAATGQLSRFELAPGRPQLAISFRDSEDRTVDLAAFRGKTVVLNFWATWCAPCVKEMPSLDRAQAALGSQFKVLALSLDAASSRPKVAPFYRDRKLDNLEIHFDIGRQAFQALNIVVLPTTVVIDGSGREVGRLQGEADWDSKEALALIRSVAASAQ
jgi:thiol-disulfide isomerase/thioredoxin